jgi:hypothetical protein
MWYQRWRRPGLRPLERSRSDKVFSITASLRLKYCHCDLSQPSEVAWTACRKLCGTAGMNQAEEGDQIVRRKRMDLLHRAIETSLGVQLGAK